MVKKSALFAEMGNFRKSLHNDNHGGVAVEFALWVTLFFIASLGAFDLAEMYFKRSQMGSAVSAASLQAFDERDNVKFHELTAYVRALSNDETLTVNVSCNGVANSCTNLNRTCACLTREGTFAMGQCGAQCLGSNMTSGVTAGYYLTITASQPFNPALMPKEGAGSQLSQTATVRLQ